MKKWPCLVRVLCKPLLYVLLMVAVTQLATAATVRGRLDRVAPNGARYPAAGVAVTVYNQSAGRSSPAHAGQDGLYYLNNVPAGHYTLEIWVSPDPRVPPTVYQIQVVEPLTDIPPIVVR
jgi:hypothetical protein